MEAHYVPGIFMAFGMCVFVPVAMIAGLVYLVLRLERGRHAERMALIDRGVVPGAAQAAQPAAAPRRAPDRAALFGWAAGLLVAGLLWLVSDLVELNGFGILLTGLGAAYLTRGILLSRREAEEGDVR